MMAQGPITQQEILHQNQATVMQQRLSLSPQDLTNSRENPRNYVFVDEHNRHKRLKVMRACEGCRRRKIKCDAATTNSWPCSACVRLKLTCLPPQLQYAGEFAAQTQVVLDSGEGHTEYDGPGSGEDDPHQMYGNLGAKAGPRYMPAGSTSYRNVPLDHHGASIAFQHPMSQGSAVTSPMQPMHPQYSHVADYHEPWEPEQSTIPTAASVAGVLGQLKIEDSGVASYISAQGANLAKTPAYEPWEEFQANPSFMPAQHDFAVKIPPEKMPSDQECLELFAIYFEHVHPYIPVVNKAAFYAQWQNARDNISPLLLEAMFACASRLQAGNGSDSLRGMDWISMATRHMECFMDVPRISTVQALLLLLKARESAPQRGYFFRSWMSVVSIIAMARDLKLDKHYEMHKNQQCHDSPLDCMTRTRIWQAIFVFELMICAPQGRDIMTCNPDCVDLQVPSRNTDLDDDEVAIHRDFVYFVYLVKNIRRMNDVHAKLKQTPNWRHDPEFLECGPSLENWSYHIPPSLHIEVPTDLSIPMPPLHSHFSANLQTYYNLAKIMLNRPALSFVRNFTPGGEWKEHLSICYTSAKAIVRLCEAVWEHYGMLGVKSMMRGVNFTIYAVLTCTMIHMIAATCPDPDFNTDAKEYFTKAMRILERCIDISASSETKGQIEALREAFSLDLSRPFVLNPDIPFYQPMQMEQPPTIVRTQPPLNRGPSYSQAEAGNPYQQPPLSPPQSSSGEDGKGDSPAAVHSLVMMSTGQRPTSVYDTNMEWNPQKLLESWGAAFPGVNGPPQPRARPPPVQHVSQNGVDPMNGRRASQAQYAPQPVAHTFGVSPAMWHDSVTAVYGEAGKRPFPFGDDHVWVPTQQNLSPHMPVTSMGQIQVSLAETH